MGLSRRLLPLALVFIVVGLATSFVGPYLALFLTEELHAGPIQTTGFLIVVPISAIVVAQLMGRVSDSRPIRRKLLIGAALAGVIGAALTAVLRNYWAVLAVTVTATAVAGALFPQSFAYARQVLDRDDPGHAAMATSTLRTLFSVAWVGGPPLAALVLTKGGFGGTYALAAAMYLVAAVAVVVGLPEVPAATAAPVEAEAEAEAAGPGRLLLFLTVAGFTLQQTAQILNVQAMPLFVRADLHGSIRAAGLILGLCAALEIPLMLGLAALSTRIPLRRLILFGALCEIVYQAIATSATSVWMLAAAQLLQAIVIAAVSGLGISYLQDLLPRQPGRASTLVSNTFRMGTLLSAPLFGIAQHFGFRLAYGLGLGLAVLALLLLLASIRVRAPAHTAPALVP